MENELKRTPLYDLHTEYGGKFVPFAGYDMPVQYSDGVKTEHLWTREHAGLFDVSHMGPSFLFLKDGLGEDDGHRKIAELIETLVPGNIKGLKLGQGRLSVLLNEQGGILDDLIITRMPDTSLNGMLYIVVNGAMKQQDWALLENKLGEHAMLQRADDRILIALQGPESEAVLAPHFPEAASLKFMQCAHIQRDGERFMVSRCGYTGEDGFELLLPSNQVGLNIVQGLLENDQVKPIGLGARDSLRLEAGLCLYGNDITEETTPVEGDLSWLISKRRKEALDFPGGKIIGHQLNTGVSKKRVGIQPLSRAPARDGTLIQKNGQDIGVVTSGGFGPSVNAPVAMGYVATQFTTPGTEIDLIIRGKAHPAQVCDLPFIESNYKR